MTTGNMGGFDAWLDEGEGGRFELACNHGELQLSLNEIGIDDQTLDAGGLERKIRVFRLPETNPHRELEASVEIPLAADRDNPLWICVTTEDGFQGWSSPVFVFK